MPETLRMLLDDIQRANEFTFNRKLIHRYLRQEVLNCPDSQIEIDQCVTDIIEWASASGYYHSKQTRLDALVALGPEKLRDIVVDLTSGCAACQEPETFTSISAQLAGILGWNDKQASITTIAELLVHLARNNLIVIQSIGSTGEGAKYGKESLAVVSTLELPPALQEYIERSAFLLPMLVPPNIVKRNNQSGYLTFNSPVTLNGRINGQTALDVINTLNQTPLRIDPEFVELVDERNNKPLTDPDKRKSWFRFRDETVMKVDLILHQTKGKGTIFFDHKFDVRGRGYCHGYHLNYQGNAYRKAMIEFDTQEFIDVPEEFRLEPDPIEEVEEVQEDLDYFDEPLEVLPEVPEDFQLANWDTDTEHVAVPASSGAVDDEVPEQYRIESDEDVEAPEW